MKNDKKTALVAMSGGVDSSVAAALLLRNGFGVTGVTFRMDPCLGQGGDGSRSGSEGEDEARTAAEKLGIPHRVIDCRDEFERLVLKRSWLEYDAGRTPNPCAICNRDLKFGTLLREAANLGADCVATGHYARLVKGDGDRDVRLLRGRDSGKDQSYFLFSLSREQLSRAIFPLGELTKAEVRRLAREFGLANAERKESQDACAVLNDEGLAETLRLRFGGRERLGRIVTCDGEEVGRHRGVHRFTVGQRKGIGVSLGRRAYVASIDSESSDVIVSADEESLLARGLVASGLNWLAKEPAAPSSFRCEAQIRYRHAAVGAGVELPGDGSAIAAFDNPQRAVTPGQAVVFYSGDRVVGGGWIDRALR